MPLRVASCPKCKSALVFGERACRGCGQTFQYGSPGPPEPTAAQIVEALAAVGIAQAPAPAALQGLDTGRFAQVADVEIEDVPGFMASSIFAAYTPDQVATEAVQGLELGRFDEVGPVAPAFTPGLEVTPRDEIGDVFVQPVSGIFRSDIYATPDDVPATDRVDGFEPSPSAPRAPGGEEGRPVTDGPLAKVLCRCSEVHRLPRCPACGTPHPERQ